MPRKAFLNISQFPWSKLSTVLMVYLNKVLDCYKRLVILIGSSFNLRNEIGPFGAYLVVHFGVELDAVILVHLLMDFTVVHLVLGGLEALLVITGVYFVLL